jgi:CSLREA domain-containing protein
MNSFVKTLLGLCFVLCFANAAWAVTYTVTKVADTNDGACDSDCSLREAIVAAGASATDDTIEFSGVVFNTAQTIVLSGTDLIITNNGGLVINGTGTNLLTVSGNNASRVFTNNTGAGTEIRNLRVTGGNGVSTVGTGRGGGVYNSGGRLTLTNVVVTGNSTTNGGGLNNAGTATLTLVNCTVSNNSATGSGGGMQNFSGNTTNIIGSTFTGNTSNSTTVGGGAIQANGTLNIANSTFSGNTATGGSGAIYYNGTSLTLNNVTIANNTSTNGAGGLHKSITTNTANLRNNLIAGNTGNAASPDVFGAINSLGNNLIGAVGSSTGWVASDVLNQAANIGALADNGGLTQTHALLSTSAAINAGDNCVTNLTCAAGNPFIVLTNDQRDAGFPRLVGAAVDIGAFELASTVVPRPAAFDFDGDFKTDYGVFRSSNGTWFLNRSTSGAVAVPFGASSDKLTPADFDGDGRTDIAVWREGAFAYFYILQSSDNTFRAEQFGQTGDNPSVVGNWDGDNKADVAVYRNGVGAGSQNFFFYRPSTQAGVNFIPVQWGTAGDEPVRGDFDGDGRADAAVFRASNNLWYIRQSANSQPRYESWGIASDKRVSGDFDGDGKTDLAIFRDGLWAILQSSNNAQIYRQFGQTADKVVAGDYDGDGKTDLAIWRSGVFYVLRSNGSQVETFSFGATTDAPVAAAFVQ